MMKFNFRSKFRD